MTLPVHTDTPRDPRVMDGAQELSLLPEPCPEPGLVPLAAGEAPKPGKSCRREGNTWEIPVEEEQQRAEKVNGLGG